MPSWTSLTEPELLAHREKVATEQPSLPQCAGRAVRKLYRQLQGAKAKQPAGGAVGKRKPVVVSPVVLPQPDVDRMAKALPRAAEELAKRDDLTA